MATPYLGEIRLVGFNFAPVGWALCNGALLSIAQNDALFNLIGTTYGGDGQTTFALPDLRGRVPMHQNSSFPLGQIAGAETETLNTTHLPAHTHNAQCNVGSTNSSGNPSGKVWLNTAQNQYSNASPAASMNALSPAGGNQPHENMPPFLVINFVIAVEGVYPSQ